MIYFLLFLSTSLTTALILTLRRLRQQQIGAAIAQQKLKETERKISKFEQAQRQLVQSEQMIETLNQRIAELETRTDELQQLTDANKRLREDNESLYNNIEIEIENRTREIQRQKQALEVLNEQIRAENQILKVESTLIKNQTIFLQGSELDLYPEERREILIDILRSSLNNVRDESRRQHIIADILAHNTTDCPRESMKTEIQALFRDYQSMSRGMRKSLERLGFEIVSDNNHYKIVFWGDRRYTYSFAKTPSDWRAGRNIARDICNLFL